MTRWISDFASFSKVFQSHQDDWVLKESDVCVCVGGEGGN